VISCIPSILYSILSGLRGKLPPGANVVLNEESRIEEYFAAICQRNFAISGGAFFPLFPLESALL
jgi:hypothetical protein